ncbi:hypothetical protein A2935_01635 [Candidatus Wolfebacteria bacterium RIFCSPLOWO2_01_FULL_47_17b]|uniref:Glycosyltransferase 2-like domain-containing protein n=1 Tax=Candidatus Wolfebacteria bacterium RIFCSPLOWO2_01_FULL_47_17b TaxID=1802558 RepID=A0A1F8E114_9BACT|nr:MAG: hypothetical protein A2935_01635 [Candidatus Wolfebacteria bacterium RIFCSPLOWO2_01_FULL_47_17b]
MKFSLVIPAYDEGATIESVVRGVVRVLRRDKFDFEVVVVDNGSTDNTAEILAALKKEMAEVKTVRVFPNRGYGNGFLTGLSNSSGEILGWMHADSQVDPEKIPALYNKLLSEDLDLCRAVRIERKESFFRIVQSRAYNTLFRLLFGGRHRDINGSPKIFKRAFYERLNLFSRDWFLDPELMIKAMRIGSKIGEVEIYWDARKGGPSHVSLLTALEFLKNLLKYRFFSKGLLNINEKQRSLNSASSLRFP